MACVACLLNVKKCSQRCPTGGERINEGSDSNVRFLIGKNAATSAAAAGFVATMVATVTGLWFPGVKLPQFDFNTLNGRLALGDLTFPVSSTTFIIGGIIHMIDGIILALIFGLLISPVLGVGIKPLPPLTPTVNLVKRLIWGRALWLIYPALLMPVLIGALLGPTLTGPFQLPCGVGPFLTC